MVTGRTGGASGGLATGPLVSPFGTDALERGALDHAQRLETPTDRPRVRARIEFEQIRANDAHV